MLKYPVVAVDYDGTITIKDNYPNAGELNPLAIHYLKEYKKLGGKLILFTKYARAEAPAFRHGEEARAPLILKQLNM